MIQTTTTRVAEKFSGDARLHRVAFTLEWTSWLPMSGEA